MERNVITDEAKRAGNSTVLDSSIITIGSRRSCLLDPIVDTLRVLTYGAAGFYIV